MMLVYIVLWLVVLRWTMLVVCVGLSGVSGR